MKGKKKGGTLQWLAYLNAKHFRGVNDATVGERDGHAVLQLAQDGALVGEKPNQVLSYKLCDAYSALMTQACLGEVQRADFVHVKFCGRALQHAKVSA